MLACYVLRKATSLVTGLVVHRDRALANLVDGSLGLVFSQSVLLALVEAGMTRDDAYRVVQRDARASWAEGRSFRQVLDADPEVTLDAGQLDAAFDLDRSLRHAGRVIDALGEVGGPARREDP
jgi:adenylosuccinate lyase